MRATRVGATKRARQDKDNEGRGDSGGGGDCDNNVIAALAQLSRYHCCHWARQGKGEGVGER